MSGWVIAGLAIALALDLANLGQHLIDLIKKDQNPADRFLSLVFAVIRVFATSAISVVLFGGAL